MNEKFTHIFSFLINTLLQRGVIRRQTSWNRFNGFGVTRQTVKTVFNLRQAVHTPLKQGVNENGFCRTVLGLTSGIQGFYE